MNKVLYMGQTEVTAGQYRRSNPYWSMLFEDAEPAIVTWAQASRFCAWFQERLEQATGRKWHCRLPTEAEWEYAARYGRPPGEDWWPVAWDKYWHGPNALMDLAWFSRNSDDTCHPVAQKMPNPLGLHDMLGNAAEWCTGWLTTSVETMLAEDGKPDEQYDRASLLYPETEMKYRSRPARGGDFLSSEDDCRPSRRYPWSTCGFRVVALPRD